MPSDGTTIGERKGFPWRAVGWGGAVLLLLLPFVAMQFSREVNWSAADFLLLGAMLGGVGLAFEFLVRRSRNSAYRIAVGIALLGAFLTVWVNLAVGMIGSEDNPVNLIFFGVIAIALVGTIVARFEPRGMARAMSVAVVAQGLAALFALVMGTRYGDTVDAVRLAILIGFFAAPWALSAALFAKAAREEGR